MPQQPLLQNPLHQLMESWERLAPGECKLIDKTCRWSVFAGYVLAPPDEEGDPEDHAALFWGLQHQIPKQKLSLHLVRCGGEGSWGVELTQETTGRVFYHEHQILAIATLAAYVEFLEHRQNGR